MTTDAYCEEKGTPPGSTAYYCRLFAPEAAQPALTALYALGREVRSIPNDVSEPGAARMKVAWWQTEIERLYEGSAGHPVTRALAPAVDRFDLDRALFDDLVALADSDIEHPGHADADALLDRARRAAALQRLETEICGYESAETPGFAERLGIALELCRIVRDLRADAVQGRVHVPVDELQSRGIQAADLVNTGSGGELRELVADQVRRAHAHLDDAERALPAVDHHRQVSGLVAAALQRALLVEIERDGYRVLHHRIELTPVRRFWLAWRTARRARRIARKAGRNTRP